MKFPIKAFAQALSVILMLINSKIKRRVDKLIFRYQRHKQLDRQLNERTFHRA